VSLIDEFCDYYHAYHDISDHRRRMQRRVLAAVALHTPGELSTLTAGQLRAFLSARVAAGACPNTIRKELSAIRPFLTWLWETRRLTAEQLMELREVKAPRGASGATIPRPYKAKDLKRFWGELEYAYPWTRSTWRGVKDPREIALLYVERWQRGQSPWGRVQPYAKRLQMEAIVALALYGGIRREEIFRLELEEMHPDNEYVVVRGAAKNQEAESRDRAVPWVDPMREAVAAWLAFRAQLAPAHDRPWLSLHQQHRLKAMHFRQFGMLMRNIGRGWEFHRMRHTFATYRLAAGIAIDKLQKIMGHKRIQQTLAYAEIQTGDVVEANERSAARFVQTLDAHRRAA
jgi:site-specific recombinase XerD